jgi:hypothetical protein
VYQSQQVAGTIINFVPATAGTIVYFGQQLLAADNIDGSQDISFLSVLSVLSLLSHQQIARGGNQYFRHPR